MSASAQDDADTIRRDFGEAVNMTAGELQKWLDTDESQQVGWSGGEKKTSADGEESVGHESGRRIVELLQSKKADLDEDDLSHMKKVVGYVHRHLGQSPPPTAMWRHRGGATA